jgi:acyl-CoA hydrolase
MNRRRTNRDASGGCVFLKPIRHGDLIRVAASTQTLSGSRTVSYEFYVPTICRDA